MAKVTIPASEQAEQFQISPDYVRISMAAAIQLGLKPGRIASTCCKIIPKAVTPTAPTADWRASVQVCPKTILLSVWAGPCIPQI